MGNRKLAERILKELSPLDIKMATLDESNTQVFVDVTRWFDRTIKERDWHSAFSFYRLVTLHLVECYGEATGEELQSLLDQIHGKS